MRQIGSIQILRALAALMVVLAHAQDDAAFAAGKVGQAFVRSSLLPWVAGVDLFFVISGFIMVHASQRLFATPGAAQVFLTRRAIRIVPLYWIVTAIALVVAALLARSGHAARMPSLAEITTSLGFIPFARPGDGVPRPIVALGWTLNYEMFFYVVFAAFLFFRREAAVGGVAASLALLVAVGALTHPGTALAFWSDPIVLEFVLGMGIALAWQHGLALPRPVAVALAVAAIVGLGLDLAHMRDVAIYGVDPSGFSRLLACGVPVAALFAAVVLARPPTAANGPLATRLLLLGDASYALYLFHPLVLVPARKAYLAAHLAPALGFWPLVIAELIVAALVAIAVHLWIERPITRALNARFADRRSAASLPGTPAPVR